MSKIVISNVEFPFDLGCKVLKLKYKDECPIPQLEDFWNEIVPANFQEVALLPNLEQRRIGIFNLGIDAIVRDAKPKLLSRKTITKQTTWVTESGDLEEVAFDDTYELFRVSGDVFNKGLSGWGKISDCYYVRCKDTSTDREYLIWIDLNSVWNVKCENDKELNRWEFDIKKIDAIDCIAWTIQTDIPKGNIEKIVRQGDCIMIKPKGSYNELSRPRHLSKNEYLKLLVAES